MEHFFLSDGSIYENMLDSGILSFRILPRGICISNGMSKSPYSFPVIVRNGVITNWVLYNLLLDNGIKEDFRYDVLCLDKTWYIINEEYLEYIRKNH